MNYREMELWAVGESWMGWPTDVGQTAVAVIAKTREAWALQGNASPLPAATVINRTEFDHPSFGLALDAKVSLSGRAGGIRARSRRRAPRKFTV